MPWKKITRPNLVAPSRPRRTGVCISRSLQRPDAAYMMMPKDMAPMGRVSIYHDGGSRIAFQFDVAGEYAVRQTSKTSYTVKITIPREISGIIPFGLHDITLTSGAEGMLVLDLRQITTS